MQAVGIFRPLHRLEENPHDNLFVARINTQSDFIMRAEDIPLARRAAALGYLILIEFFCGWAWNTVDVLRPVLRKSLNLTLIQTGSGYSAQGAGAMLGAIVIGQLADRFGRRKALIGATSGYGMALLSGFVVNSLATFIAQRFVLGVFMGGVDAVIVGIYVGLFAAPVRGRLASCFDGSFNLSIIALGVMFGALGTRDWRWLLVVGGVPALVLAALAPLVIPDGRRYSPFGMTGEVVESPAFPIRELFREGRTRATLLLALMIGLNFFAYQAFNGWLSTYLIDTRHLGDSDVGSILAWLFTANIMGCFFWGWSGDRFGRRRNAIGFIICAATVGAVLHIEGGWNSLRLLAAAYGFSLSCSVIWAPWIAELYPATLRSTAASIFQWGRVISFFAPLATGAVAEKVGLGFSMSMASVAFVGAALIWIQLPETLGVSKN